MAQVLSVKHLLVRICPQDQRKLEVSHNQGMSWQTRFFGNIMMGNILDIELPGDGYLYAYAEKGVFRSQQESLTSFQRRN